MSPFLTFQKFNDQGLALELGALLQENNIEYELDSKSNFDPGFSNNELIREYRIKLRKEDFSKADNLLQQVFAKQMDEVDKDHYLFAFTNEELMDIISKRDEWSQFDFLLAQKILRERGKEIKPEAIETLGKQRLTELAKPDKSQKTWVIVGYVFAILGGLIGLFIGWHLYTYKKHLPNGETVYGYSESDRKHGSRIMIIASVWLVIWLVRLLTADF